MRVEANFYQVESVPMGQGVDTIPGGTFFAGDYSPERIAAIRLAMTRGREFDASMEVRDEIVRLYKTGEITQLGIAGVFDPTYAEQYPDQAEVAIGYVIRKHIPEEERIEIQARRSRDSLEKNLGGFGSQQHLEHQRSAAIARHSKGIPVDAAAMTRGRGFIPWSEEERELVMSLMINDPGFLLENRKPNFALIADTLNDIYHGSTPAWNAKKVYDKVRYEQRKRQDVNSTE